MTHLTDDQFDSQAGERHLERCRERDELAQYRADVAAIEAAKKEPASQFVIDHERAERAAADRARKERDDREDYINSEAHWDAIFARKPSDGRWELPEETVMGQRGRRVAAWEHPGELT